jgi:hypothetical protein
MPVTGTWLRHIPAGSDPLHRPPTPADGRWQRGETVEGIYLAAEEATVWAEWYRWLAELEIEPLRGLPRELWRYRASLPSVAAGEQATRATAWTANLTDPLTLDPVLVSTATEDHLSPFERSATWYSTERKMRPAGIEPAACGLKDRCSLAPRREPLTTELRARAVGI